MPGPPPHAAHGEATKCSGRPCSSRPRNGPAAPHSRPPRGRDPRRLGPPRRRSRHWASRRGEPRRCRCGAWIWAVWITISGSSSPCEPAGAADGFEKFFAICKIFGCSAEPPPTLRSLCSSDSDLLPPRSRYPRHEPGRANLPPPRWRLRAQICLGLPAPPILIPTPHSGEGFSRAITGRALATAGDGGGTMSRLSAFPSYLAMPTRDAAGGAFEETDHA